MLIMKNWWNKVTALSFCLMLQRIHKRPQTPFRQNRGSEEGDIWWFLNIFYSAVLRSLLYGYMGLDLTLFFSPRTVCCAKMHLRQMPNPATHGRSDKHRKEEYLLHVQNTHLAAAQLKKECKCSAHSYIWYAFSDECRHQSLSLTFFIAVYDIL